MQSVECKMQNSKCKIREMEQVSISFLFFTGVDIFRKLFSEKVYETARKGGCGIKNVK